MAAAALSDGRHHRLVFQPLEGSEDVGKGEVSLLLQLGGVGLGNAHVWFCVLRAATHVVGANKGESRTTRAGSTLTSATMWTNLLPKPDSAKQQGKWV